MNNVPEYQAEIWQVKKDIIYSAIHSLNAGIEYLQMCILEHDKTNGRTAIKNKRWAEIMEKDLAHMQKTLSELRGINNPALS